MIRLSEKKLPYISGFMNVDTIKGMIPNEEPAFYQFKTTDSVKECSIINDIEKILYLRLFMIPEDEIIVSNLVMSVIAKLSEGNPGRAITILIYLLSMVHEESPEQMDRINIRHLHDLLERGFPEDEMDWINIIDGLKNKTSNLYYEYLY